MMVVMKVIEDGEGMFKNRKTKVTIIFDGDG